MSFRAAGTRRARCAPAHPIGRSEATLHAWLEDQRRPFATNAANESAHFTEGIVFHFVGRRDMDYGGTLDAPSLGQGVGDHGVPGDGEAVCALRHPLDESLKALLTAGAMLLATQEVVTKRGARWRWTPSLGRLWPVAVGCGSHGAED